VSSQSVELQVYELLTKAVLLLDELPEERWDKLTDQVRDVMDPIWFALTDQERLAIKQERRKQMDKIDDAIEKESAK
jgi:hypothetical protein